MPNRVCLLLPLSLLLTWPSSAGAKKPPIELDPGFYCWDDFSYSEDAGPGKGYEQRLLDLAGALCEHYSEVITYDGDSTLTNETSYRLRLSEDTELSRWGLTVIDPGLGEQLELIRAVMRRQGRPDVSFVQDDLREEAYDSVEGYYSSARTYYLELPEDAAASTLELEFRVTTRAHPGLEGFVRAIRPLQVGGYTRERELVIRYPADAPLHIRERGFTSRVKPRRAGDLSEVRYELQHLRPMTWTLEVGAAHPLANYPTVTLSSLGTWDEFNALYLAEYETRAVADAAIRARVAELTEGLATEGERAEAIYRYVTEELHYLGIFLGESGILPHPAAEVFERGFGDCKDHSVLLLTMLREAGITTSPVAIHAGQMGFVDPEFPTWVANHAIVQAVVDGQAIFLDGTSSPYLFAAPSPWIRHRDAMVFTDDGLELVETPPGDPAMRSTTETIRLRVAPDGGLVADVELVLEGSPAAALRDDFRTRPREDIDRNDRTMVFRTYRMPDELTIEQEEDPASGSGPLTRHIRLRTDQHVRRSGPVMLLDLPLLALPPAVEVGRRAHDFPVYVEPFHYRLRLELDLPRGYALVDPPEPIRRIKAGGKYEVSVSSRGDVFEIEADATWHTARLAAAAAESYAQFRTELFEVLDLQLVLREVGR